MGHALIIVFITGLTIVLCIVAFVLRLIFGRQDNAPSAEELHLIDDMSRTIQRLEDRVAVLETLLSEQDRHTRER